MIYITWLGGHKTRHKMDVLCKKCPQKMLRYLEQKQFIL
ncbi:hypothetical protein FOTG_17619 [Fusarium oxysporum f. sp. vasinfectum 25433]|uniref:Chromo shadow domain-containing protein n=1 Tax=Fusarium oxysporum f. sp. vasinfectum 25433 TaxID=1089449 RepID=X0KZ38_FUSOX|nr:hypothetical protein FOTG_17619 [Fusarium oxysporum f. sp. vasinfectum 25433]